MSSPGQPAGTPSARFDPAGNWLADRYQLDSSDRKRVKTATLQGEAVSDPRLNEAVRGLASEILGNRLRMPGIRAYYTNSAVAGVLGLAALAIALSPVGRHSRYEEGLIVLAVLAVLNVIMYSLWLPGHTRRNVAKALRVNSGSER